MINQLEQISQARKWGNSGGVLLPKDWIGKQVKVILIDRTQEIKKEVFDILSEYLEDIQGIYLVGSYARSEQTKDSDIDIIVISNRTKKIINSGMYNIQIYTYEGIKNTLKHFPISIYPSLLEAKTIMNQSLLNELLKIKPSSKSYNQYIEECKRVLSINKKIIEIEKQKGKYLKSQNIVYSLFLRLRGIYILKSIKNKIKPNKKDFYKHLRSKISLSDKSWEMAVSIYKAIKNNKSIKVKYSLEDTNKILNLLEIELKNYDKP